MIVCGRGSQRDVREQETKYKEVSNPESIEWFIECQAFSISYDLASPPPRPARPLPSPSVSSTGDTQEDWVRDTLQFADGIIRWRERICLALSNYSILSGSISVPCIKKGKTLGCSAGYIFLLVYIKEINTLITNVQFLGIDNIIQKSNCFWIYICNVRIVRYLEYSGNILVYVYRVLYFKYASRWRIKLELLSWPLSHIWVQSPSPSLPPSGRRAIMYTKLQRFLNLRYWSSGGET